MSVPEEVLKGLQEAVEAKKAIAANPQVEEIEEIEEAEEDGFKSYEDYIKDGGDPDFYRGKKVYAKQKEMIKELKDHKEKFKKLDDYVFEQEQIKLKELEKRDKEIEKLKKQAREEMDIDAYDELIEEQQEIKAAKKAAEKQEHKGGEAGFIAQFRDENPALNPAHPDFDEDYTILFTAKYNKSIGEAEKRAGRQLTEQEAANYLESVKKSLEKPEIKRQSKVTPTKAVAAAKKDPLAAMPDNVRSQYERWLKDPKRKQYAEQMAKQYGV